MDTQNTATVEIPNFKLAKVGKDRDRKRGGGWLSGGRGAGSGFSGAVGGSGAGGGVGLFGLGAGATKALITVLVSTLACAGAWQYGKMMSAKYSVDQKGGRAKVFDSKSGPQKYDDLSGVVKADNSIPNSLGYVSGSTDGLTPEERAKKAAEAEAARKAEEEAKKKAEEEANKQPETPASAPVDPNAVAEAGAAKKGLTAGKFGQLGSFNNTGGGLSGGSGLSGGINRNFGGASGLTPKAQNGSLASFRNQSKPASAGAPHAMASKSRAKGFAKRQLDNAFTQSRQAMSAGKTESAATGAAAPFDNNPGEGNVIAGPGVGSGSKSGTAESGNSLNPTNGGGPLNDNGGAACASADYAPDQNGVCQKIKTNGPKNGAPYQGLIEMAKMLMMLTAVFAGLVLIFKGKGPWGEMIADAFSAIIATIGAIEIALGIAILAMSGGDKVIGGITMAVGALTVGSAFMPKGLLSDNQVLNIAAGALISNAVGALATSAASKSQLQ